MVALSMVLVFLLVLSRSESELDAKIPLPGEATEWRNSDQSLPGSCQPAPSCQKCILSHPSCAWCKQLVNMGLWSLNHVQGMCGLEIYMYDGVGTCAILPACTLQSCVRLTDFVHLGPLAVLCVCMHVHLCTYCEFVYIWTRRVTMNLEEICSCWNSFLCIGRGT